MAGSFTPTGSYSNLTRLELEQLRKADFFAGGKGLTVGDSALPPEGVVGKGDINAEPYFTGQSLLLDDVYGITPPTLPGPGLGTLTTTQGVPSETARWFGPTHVFDSTRGTASAAGQWSDDTPALNFTLFVQPGDLLLIKPNPAMSDSNASVVGTITVVAASTLTVSNIFNPTTLTTTFDTTSGGVDRFPYVIVRPTALPLFAVPGSGPVGREQTFLAVIPGSTVINNIAPTLDVINSERVRNIVPPFYSGTTAVDRADFVFDFGTPRIALFASLQTLGYRIVLYPDLGNGTGPDLTRPIATLNPIIDPAIPAADSRMTFDYKAGIIRFSDAPALGGDIKRPGVTNSTNPTTGRLNLYAVYWAVDQTLTEGAARSLYTVRSDDTTTRTPGKVFWDAVRQVWSIGHTTQTNNFTVSAPDPSEFADGSTAFGTFDPANSAFEPTGARYFVYRSAAGKANVWKFKRSDSSSIFDLPSAYEVVVADKTAYTVGDGASPPVSPGGDLNPIGLFNIGYRNLNQTITGGLKQMASSGYGTFHLRRGKYLSEGDTIYVPPGVLIEGEGAATSIEARANGSFVYNPIFKFGPNTYWGVYDFDFDPNTGDADPPNRFFWTDTTRLEGIATVWNPVRRVWGVVQADATTNGIYFNEVNTDGTFTLPGLGMEIKQSAAVLFTVNSPNASNHTGAHYPRVAHHNSQDEYLIIWTEESGGGPVVAWQILNRNFSIVTSIQYVRKFISNQYPSAFGTFRNHPSVAVDNSQSNAGFGYTFVIVYEAYTGLGSRISSSVGFEVIASSNGVTLNSSQATLTGQNIVTSTDVSSDDQGNYLFVYSIHRHQLWYSTAGTVLGGGNTLTDAGALFNVNTSGGFVQPGSRVLVLASTGATKADQGRSGVVGQVVGPTQISVIFDEHPGGLTLFTENATFTYAIAPVSWIEASYLDNTGTFSTGSAVLAGDATTTTSVNYNTFEREPDFVRICRGSDSWLVAYQTFDTTAYFSHTFAPNFDNQINQSFHDNPSGVPKGLMSSLVPQRQHISTCYVMVGMFGVPMAPSNTNTPGYSPGTFGALGVPSDEQIITARSLGGRHVNIPYPDALSTTERFELQISARNYTYPWKAVFPQRPVSLIPAVTWSGSDWLVVSPSVNRIESDTGTYLEDPPASGNFWLIDPTFYFGDGNPSAIDGSFLQPTVDVGSDQIFFPAATVGSQYQTISAVSSEHVIAFSGAVPGLVSGTTYSWKMIKGAGASTTISNGIKNPGFRVSPQGDVVLSSSYFTFADSIRDNDLTTPRQTETLNRLLWGETQPQTLDANFNPTIRYGATYPSWNDIVASSRLKVDLTYQGVAVGTPKGCNETTDEPPMVAIAWGENFYGFLERRVQGSVGFRQNQVTLQRQSFGPWNSGLSNLSLIGGKNNQTILTREHVFTRHGYTVSGNSGFATDGYRNCHVHLSYRFLRGTQDTLSAFDTAYSGDVRDDTAYTADISAVYTDATGRNPIRFRGPLFASSAEREPYYGAVGNGGQFSPFLQGIGNKFLNAATPKVIWNGQHFVAFVPGALQKIDTSPEFFSSGPAALARIQSTITMVMFPGDENRNSVDDSLTGDSEIGNPAFFLNNIRSPKITSVGIVSCGLSVDWEAVEFTVIDVAYSGHTYCVVWSIGHNNTAAKPSTNPGGNVIGYTLFKESGGNTIPFGAVTPSTFLPGSAPSFIIESNGLSYNNAYGGKARFRDPKVVWNGKAFVISYLHLDDFGGNTGADIVGLHATVTAQGLLQIGGLTGATNDLVGKVITLTGAAQPANNGSFFITASPGGSVTLNTTGVFPDGNSGSIHWVIADFALGPMGRYLRQITVDENGNGIQPQLKATAGSASLGTIDPLTGSARALGRVVSQGFAGVNLVLDSTYANNHVQPGDLLVITNAVQYGSVGGPFLQAGTQGVNLAVGGGIMQLSDSPSSSFTAVNVDNCYITISHSNGLLNNGTFPITSFVGATTVQYANSSGLTDPIGGAASITAFVGNIATITGLVVTINEAVIGGLIEIVGAASGGNNGFFVITAIGPGATSLQYCNPAAVAPDAHNGAISWATLSTWTVRRGTAEFSGTYPVLDYDPSNRQLQLGAGFFAGNINPNLLNPPHDSILLYGHIMSGGAGTPRDADLNSWNAGPNSSATRIFSLFQATASNTITKYWTCVYNERKDEYLFVVEALVGGVSSLCLMTMRAADGAITNEVVSSPAANVTNVTAAYNGDRYLLAVVLVPTLPTAGIAFLSWSDNLGFDVGTVINSTVGLTDLVGNVGRQAPGPSYDPLDFALDPIPQFQKIDLIWNNRLNRWVASISVLWSPATPVVDDVYHAAFGTNWGAGAIVFTDAQGVTTYSNRTLTLTGASTIRQPGTRVLAQREETVHTQLFAGASEFYTETTITDPGGVDFITSDVVVGDVFIRFDSGGGDNTDLHRTIAFVTPTELLITGTFTGTNNTTSHGYQIRRVNRAQLTSDNGGTVTYGVSHVQDTNRNFGTFNVAAGDRLYINGNILVFVVAVSTTTNPNDTISFTPSITPAVANGTHYSVQRNTGYLFNIVKTADNTHLTIDASSTEQRTPTFLTSGQTLFRVPREDVFVVTIGNDAPAVRIEDADQVYLQNVDVSGPADVEERYINLARPIYQVGGMVYGKADNLVGTGTVVYRPRPGVAFDFLTPVNKVETVRLTNVRSKARAKYGWGLDNGARRLDRYTSGRKS